MARFGSRSQEFLEGLDIRLVRVLEKAIEMYDFSVISGHRGEEEQNDLLRRGLSKKKFPNSRHNVFPSMAVDIAPYPIDWSDDERFYFLAGIIRACAHRCKTEIRWGGDWDSDDDLHDQTFMDLGHFEILED